MVTKQNHLITKEESFMLRKSLDYCGVRISDDQDDSEEPKQPSYNQKTEE